MAGLDERLNQLISDQESMKKILEMAKVIMGQQDSDGPAPAASEPPAPQQETQPSAAAPDLSALLSSMLSQQPEPSAPQTQPPPSSTSAGLGQGLLPLAAVLPQLMQAMSGEGNLLKSERVNLLQAMRPYLNENRLNSIDRALKMANVTKAATSAMHLLGGDRPV